MSKERPAAKAELQEFPFPHRTTSGDGMGTPGTDAAATHDVYSL
jgi:hypothetical protein